MNVWWKKIVFHRIIECNNTMKTIIGNWVYAYYPYNCHKLNKHCSNAIWLVNNFKISLQDMVLSTIIDVSIFSNFNTHVTKGWKPFSLFVNKPSIIPRETKLWRFYSVSGSVKSNRSVVSILLPFNFAMICKYFFSKKVNVQYTQNKLSMPNTQRELIM